MDVSLTHSYHMGASVGGIKITQLLKEDESTRHVPVLLATAHAMAGDRERLLEESGADGYISKPIIDYEAFLATVRQGILSGV